MSSPYDMDTDDDDTETSSTFLAALKFPDDFAEFQARADSGGSTYGVLKRHAFAQQSLRVVTPSDPDVDVVVPQRRANSLIPPSMSPHSAASQGDDDGSVTVDQKMIIAVLCSDKTPQQQRRHRYKQHHRQHQQNSTQQKRQQSEKSAIQMDTLQVRLYVVCMVSHSQQ